MFFVGDRAYKLKKPLRFDFLDFREREVREAICHREVDLNRRLAPDVYLGVADVLGPGGLPMDHLVVMRRLPATRRLSTLVRSGADTRNDLLRLARLLAGFHSTARTSSDIQRAAGRDALLTRWEANAAEMQPFIGPLLDEATAGRVTALARRYLSGRGPLFEARISDGRARDGHGDLLADDIFCLDDGPRVLDCIEFDDELRWGDALGDVAFLAMDLEFLGRSDLAEHFLRAYREFAADSWPESLAHHHVAYRAQVRAKVSCLRWSQGDEVAAEAARDLLALAREHLERGRVRLLIVGGLPGTGKSTLAAGLGGALGAVVLRSDELRKQLAGMDTTTRAPAPFGEGIYRRDATAATYREMLARARVALAHGESVVLDASWLDPSWRDAARRLALETVADLGELRCVAPPGVAEHRIRARAHAGASDASDASVSISSSMAALDAAWPQAVDLDTTRSREQVLREALERVDG